MQRKRPVIVRVEFYNFLSYYLFTVNACLAFAAQQLDHAELLASTALSSINPSVEKKLFEEISFSKRMIKNTSEEIKCIRAKLQRERESCKKKEYEDFITIKAED